MKQRKYNAALDMMLASALAFKQGNATKGMQFMAKAVEAKSFGAAVALLDRHNETAAVASRDPATTLFTKMRKQVRADTADGDGSKDEDMDNIDFDANNDNPELDDENQSPSSSRQDVEQVRNKTAMSARLKRAKANKKALAEAAAGDDMEGEDGDEEDQFDDFTDADMEDEDGGDTQQAALTARLARRIR